MPDTYTEVTSQSWFGKLAGSIIGVLIGIVFFIGSIALLSWNENRTVERARTLSAGSKEVVSIPADAVSDANEGRLVHLTGPAKVEGVLVDSQFGVSAQAVKLRRNVEMYQWKETEHSETHQKLGGGSETVKTYTYEKVWSPDKIDSTNFKKRAGHENPGTMPFATQSFIANPVTIGAFTLSGGLVAKINNFEPLPVADAAKLPANMQWSTKLVNGGYYVGDDPAQPKLGDLKIDFQVANPSTVSVVAEQTGRTFEPYHVQRHGDIELLQVGEVNAAGMFQTAQKENSTLGWILRAVGFVVMFFGLCLVGRPMVVVADVIPVFGNILGAGVAFFAFITALVGSFVTVAVAWVVVRPLVGVPLLAGAVVIFIWGHKIGRQKKFGNAAASPVTS